MLRLESLAGAICVYMRLIAYAYAYVIIKACDPRDIARFLGKKKGRKAYNRLTHNKVLTHHHNQVLIAPFLLAIEHY